MITAYLMAPVRGIGGDNVSDEEKQDNVDKAIAVGKAIRQAIPELDLYVPHEHEEIIDQIWKDWLTGDQIVQSCIPLAVKRDIGIHWTGNGWSGGVDKERKARDEAGKLNIEIRWPDELAFRRIRQAMWDIRESKKQDT